MEDDKEFNMVLAPRAALKDPIPAGLSIKRDGFNRAQVVSAFARAFEMIGGVQRMALWANANPDKFYPLYSKLLPSTAIQIGDNANVTIIHSIERTPLDEHPTRESGSAAQEEQPPLQGRSGS